MEKIIFFLFIKFVRIKNLNITYNFVILKKIQVMDAKVTLSFDQSVVNKAKLYAERNNISLSRLVEFLLQKTTSNNYTSFEDMPIADWVNQLSEGGAVYQTKKKPRKAAKAEYFSSKK